MSEGSAATHLTDIVETIERVRAVMGDTLLDAFEEDWRKQWLIERGGRSYRRPAVACRRQ
jgi:hypothetical protein